MRFKQLNESQKDSCDSIIIHLWKDSKYTSPNSIIFDFDEVKSMIDSDLVELWNIGGDKYNTDKIDEMVSYFLDNSDDGFFQVLEECNSEDNTLESDIETLFDIPYDEFNTKNFSRYIAYKKIRDFMFNAMVNYDRQLLENEIIPSWCRYCDYKYHDKDSIEIFLEDEDGAILHKEDAYIHLDVNLDYVWMDSVFESYDSSFMSKEDNDKLVEFIHKLAMEQK